MGVRSSVAMCMKNEIYRQLTDAAKATIEDYFGDYEERTSEALLFFTTDVMWYHDSEQDLIALYRELWQLESEDFLIVEGCYDHPTSEDADLGDWYDNPWGIYKDVSVSVNYRGSDNAL